MDIAEWPQDLGLERYAPAFRDNEIDERVLPSLTAEDLKDLGVTLVGRVRTDTARAAGPLPDLHRTRPEDPAKGNQKLSGVFCTFV